MDVQEFAEHIDGTSDESIAAVLSTKINAELWDDWPVVRHIVESYRLNYNSTTTLEDERITKDFFSRFIRLATKNQYEEVEKAKLEEAAKLHLVLGIASDIFIWFSYAKRTPEITTESVISLAEKLVERVQNA